MKTNLKTTITGVVTAAAVLIKTIFDIEIPTEAIIAIGIFFIGIFAKDNNVTGGTVQQ